MKKILNVLAVALFVVFAGYNVYQSQKAEVMSDIAMENVEALANTEQPNIKNCIEATSDCIALHPTDASLDQRKPNSRWPTTDYKSK